MIFLTGRFMPKGVKDLLNFISKTVQRISHFKPKNVFVVSLELDRISLIIKEDSTKFSIKVQFQMTSFFKALDCFYAQNG